MEFPENCAAKDPQEIEAISRFIRFYSQQRGTELRVIDCDVLCDDGTTNFDFLLLDVRNNTRLAVECTQLIESDQIIGNQKHTAQIFNAISKSLSQVEVQTPDIYIVTMPHVLSTRHDAKAFSDAVVNEVDRIKDRLEHRERTNFNIESVEFELSRIGKASAKDDHPVGRVHISGAGSGWVPGPTFPARLKKAFEKDRQLNTTATQVRILLITNCFILGGDVRVTLETVFSLNPLSYPNIDEVYFEISKDNHLFIYSKEV